MSLPPVTYTFHSNYENCPLKAWHINIAKDLPREKPTEALQYGRDVHRAMELRINNGTPLPPELAHLEQFARFPEGYGVRAEVKLGIRENGEPCGFFDNDVWCRGVVDVAIGIPKATVAAIADHKTGKEREDPGELELHAVLLHAHRPQLQKITGWYNWCKEGKMGKVHNLSDTRGTFRQHRGLREEIESNYRLGKEAFRPQENPLCGWCPVTSCRFNPKRGT